MQSRTATDRVMRVETAAASSQKWLERFRTAAVPDKMNELGLWLCDAILRRTYNGTYDPAIAFVHPARLTTLQKDASTADIKIANTSIFDPNQN